MPPIAILACMPVDRTQLEEVASRTPPLRSLLDKIPHYEGAIVSRCDACDQAISVGPLQQIQLDLSPATPKFCMLCALVATRDLESSVEVEAISLGNPQSE